jgi:large subunit ribosomal protein L29
MDIKELREKSDTELDRLLRDSRNKIREFRFKVAAKKMADVREIREIKKTVARILTIRKAQAAGTKPAARG